LDATIIGYAMPTNPELIAAAAAIIFGFMWWINPE